MPVFMPGGRATGFDGGLAPAAPPPAAPPAVANWTNNAAARRCSTRTLAALAVLVSVESVKRGMVVL